MKRIFWLAVTSASVIAAAVPADRGTGAPSRVIDRTLVCTLLAPLGGARDLDVLARPPIVDEFRNFSAPAFIGVSSGRVLSGPVTDRSNRVFVRARPDQLERVGRTLRAGVYANMRSCSTTRASVPLSSRGLPGPPVEFGTEAECEVRGRILVRVRAVLQSPASWLPAAPPYVGARKDVVEATLAVRSERTRGPLALIQLGRSGETKLWTGPGCA